MLDPDLRFDGLAEAMFGASPIAVVAIDIPALRVIDANPAACELFALPRSLLVGMSIAELSALPEQTVRNVHERVTGFSVGRIRRSDGTEVAVEITATHVDIAGRDVRFAFMHDVTGREESERALRESEERFRTLAEAVPQIVWATTPDGMNVYFNQRWVDYTGLTLEESYGEGWSIPFHPDDRQRSRAAWAEATVTGGKYEVEVRLRRADGVYRWWLIRGVPSLDADGEIHQWFGTCTDIDDLKQAESQVEQMNRLYATLSQVNQAIVRVKDTHELFQAMCDVAVEFGGFALAWVGLHDGHSGVVTPIAANGVDVAQWPFETVNTVKGETDGALVANAIRSGRTVVTEDIETDKRMWSVIGQDKGRDYHSIAAVPFGLRGESTGVLVLVSTASGFFKSEREVLLLEEMGLDISFALDSLAGEAARQRAEEDLRDSEQRFRGLFESSPVPVSLNEVVDDGDGEPRDYRLLYVNPAFEKFIGMTKENLVGRTITDVAPQVDRTMVARACQVAVTGVPDFFEGHSIGLNRDHETTVYSPSRGQLVTYIVDVTERRQVEQALREREHLLSASQRAAHIGTWSWRVGDAKTSWSDETFRLYGLSPDMGSPDFEFFFEIIHPEDRAIMRAFPEALMAGEHPPPVEFRVLRSDGVYRWIRTEGDVIETVDGVPSLLAGTAYDVTDRRDAEEALRRSLSSMIALVCGVVEARDPYTAGHEARVAQLAVLIAQEMGMTAERVDNIRTAALVHDVGKVSVPFEILSKPGRLTDIEFMLVQEHSEAGFQILSSADMDPTIAEMVYQHHERCDGSGYPRGLAADALLEEAKVLAVADVVEAMVSHRPYRARLGTEAALAEIERGSGTEYDASVSEACIRVFRESEFDFSTG